MKRMKKKKGMSIIDVIIAIAIFTIGVEGFTLLFTKSWQINSFVLEEGQSSLAASRGVQRTVDAIRRARQADNGAYMVVSANDNDLVLYSDIDKDGVTERVHYYLEDEILKRGTTNPAGTPPIYPAGDQVVSVVANHVVNTSNNVFTYYNSDYPGDTVNNPLSTPASVNEIGMIQVHLEVNVKPETAPDNINFQSFAALRNLDR